MLKKFRILCLLILSTLIFANVNAQNNTNSPYTRFGFGDLVDVSSGEARAMGGVSIAGRNRTGINNTNPAAYSTVDTLTFMFDLGVGGLASRFTDPGRSSVSYNSNLEYVSMLFPIGKFMGFSAGMIPYSFSGYNFYNKDSVMVQNNTNTPQYAGYSRIYSGSGGISQVYTGLGIKLFKHFSLGVNAYYMFGETSNLRNLTFTTSTLSGISGLSSTTEYNTLKVNNFRFRYGFQYFETIAKKHSISMGATYENKAPLAGNFTKTIVGIPSDTIVYDNKFELPQSIGLGLMYKYDQRLSVGLDYTLQKWGDALYFGKKDSLQNRSKWAIGGEYIPDPRGRKYADHVHYRLGLNMSDPYYKLNGNQAKNFGVTFGVGLPLRNSPTVVNLSFEYGKVGTSTLLREDYLKLTVNAAFNELWFFKRKL